MVKNPPTVQETRDLSLDQEDCLGKGMTIHASMGELHGQRSLADCSTRSHGESDTIERLTRELGWGRSVVCKGVVHGSDHLLRIVLAFNVYPHRRHHRFI